MCRHVAAKREDFITLDVLPLVCVEAEGNALMGSIAILREGSVRIRTDTPKTFVLFSKW